MNEHLSDSEIMSLIDDELDQKERKKILSHIQACKKCKRKYNSYLWLEKNLQHPETVNPPDDLLNKVMKKLSCRKKFTLEEVLIGLMISFAGIFTLLLFLIYNYGLDVFYKLSTVKINFTYLIKNGIKNFGKIVSLISKLFSIVETEIISKITSSIKNPELYGVLGLLVILLIVSFWKRDIILGYKK